MGKEDSMTNLKFWPVGMESSSVDVDDSEGEVEG